MRRDTVHRMAAMCALATTTACGFARPGATTPTSDFADVPRGHGTQSIVITGEQIRKDNRPLLDILRKHVPGMQVQYTPECPQVWLRGRSTIITPSDPSVYVDGQHASNTCILEGVDPSDVARMEIYPMGVSPRPEYFNDPYGLILIFLRRSND